MEIELITLKQYCELSDYSYDSNYVQKQVRKGNLMVGMVGHKKFGNAYMIQVLRTWKESKEKGL